MNPFLKRIGFGPQDRVVIVHADDIGAYQASLPAIDDLLHAGLVSSCATMVPCPWFPAVAAWARRNPAADIGVHATITAEYGEYRWGPISTRDRASGLLDDEGYFHRSTPAVQASADPGAAATEQLAQMERALAAGIDVTHIDSHMGASFGPAFLPGYVAAARAGRVPAFLPRMNPENLLARGLGAEQVAQIVAFEEQLEQGGMPLVDQIGFMPLDRADDRVGTARAVFDALPAGLSYLILHPAVDTPELRAITPADWPARVADYQAFCSAELRDYVRSSGVHVVGWRALRDAMRG
jgi:chitin disaccharide deacetylase